MNGYLRIKNTDLYERDGVTYWRNGGNIIGNVVKAVIEENDVITSETYYIESLKTAKPIMLDPDVKIGGLTASESKNGNFIIVSTAPADFTEYGGGAGLKITFIYGVNYYSIETVESNGDIKIYDPDGDAGTLIPDALPDTTDAAAGDVLALDEDKKPVWTPPIIPESKKYYDHHIKATKSNSYYILTTIITDSNTPFTASTLNAYIKQFTNIRIPATGWAQNSSTGLKGSVYSLRYSTDTKILVEFIKYIFTSSTPSLTSDSSYIDFDNSTIDDEVIEI